MADTYDDYVARVAAASSEDMRGSRARGVAQLLDHTADRLRDLGVMLEHYCNAEDIDRLERLANAVGALMEAQRD